MRMREYGVYGSDCVVGEIYSVDDRNRGGDDCRGGRFS